MTWCAGLDTSRARDWLAEMLIALLLRRDSMSCHSLVFVGSFRLLCRPTPESGDHVYPRRDSGITLAGSAGMAQPKSH